METNCKELYPHEMSDADVAGFRVLVQGDVKPTIYYCRCRKKIIADDLVWKRGICSGATISKDDDVMLEFCTPIPLVTKKTTWRELKIGDMRVRGYQWRFRHKMFPGDGEWRDGTETTQISDHDIRLFEFRAPVSSEPEQSVAETKTQGALVQMTKELADIARNLRTFAKGLNDGSDIAEVMDAVLRLERIVKC